VAEWLPAHQVSGSAHSPSEMSGNAIKIINYFVYYVYIIKNKDNGRLYIGSTTDLQRRLAEHNRGKTKSTRFSSRWELVYYEAHRSKSLMRKAEIFYKTGQGRRQIKKKLGLE